ncbi:MAG TPA: cytochrome c1 [Stellaceae bacterium]|jgi:ubiquinol-cytochrome c reductase cytochrome c1 subunit
MRRSLLTAAAAAILAFTAGQGIAADETVHVMKQHWSFDGPFGTYDRAAAQRGFQIYKEVCSNCHAINMIHYRDLTGIGFNEDEVKAIAAGYQTTDGPNDEGEMFQRPGRPADLFARPFANEKAARAANNGALPPDLSLIVKAREGGPDYVYSILNGYEDPPQDFKLGNGMNYNKYFPGHQIAMPKPLNDGAVTYADGTQTTVPQMAHDVVTFLTWAAEPRLEERHQTGFKVMLFLAIAAVLFYAVKRKIWADVH